jgi:D-alanyl-lipoteichoic acid acyltransferase DltB (MBOAT superfamily)
MKKKFPPHLLSYLALQVLVVVAVIFIFKLITPKNFAALWAGATFVVSSFLIFFVEFKGRRLKQNWSGFSALAFLLIFALPMLIVRAIYFEIPFDQLSIWGIAGPSFHKLSNFGYMLMVMGVIVDGIKAIIAKSEPDIQ